MLLIQFKARVANYKVVLRLFLSRCWVFKFPFYKWRDEVATFKSLQICCGTSQDNLFIMCCLQFPLDSRTTHSSAIAFACVSTLTCIEALLRLVEFEQLQVIALNHLVCIYLRGTAKSPASLKPIWENEFCFIIAPVVPLKTVKR